MTLLPRISLLYFYIYDRQIYPPAPFRREKEGEDESKGKIYHRPFCLPFRLAREFTTDSENNWKGGVIRYHFTT